MILEAAIPPPHFRRTRRYRPRQFLIDADDPSEGAYGIAIALDAAVSLAQAAAADGKPPISIRFVFLGAERRGKKSAGPAAALGTKTWIQRSVRARSLAVLYLSLDRAPGLLSLRNAGKGILSPFWYYDSVRRSLGRSGADLSSRRTACRYSDSASPTNTVPRRLISRRASRPSSCGRGFDPERKRRALAWVFIGEFSRRQAGGFSDSWDRHYSSSNSAELRRSYPRDDLRDLSSRLRPRRRGFDSVPYRH